MPITQTRIVSLVHVQSETRKAVAEASHVETS